ncbi:MAG: TonB-dependent receptor plug domain-containing protein [Trinickia sp.]|uniref:TonB-dependent receptor plug domain-containing protein n=1 Tax=Trinickia sp. TaxID=2571163 RepID=UPI003F7EB1CD
MSTLAVPAALIALAGLPLVAFAQSAPTSASPSFSPAAAACAGAGEASRMPTAATACASGGTLEPIVVTAQRGPQPLSDAIAQTTHFSRQDIADSTATDLPGLLERAPGAQVIRNGPPGSNATLFLRGGSATQSLVLIDGVRVDSVSLGQVQLGQIPLSEVDHVEVVNGDVSALYGSGAMGGVVQVFTKDGGNHPPRLSVSAGYGSYRTQTQQAGVNGALDANGKTTFSIGVARSKDDGFSAINPARAPNVNPAADGYLSESLTAALRHTFDNGWDAGARYFQSNGKSTFDNPYGVPSDVNELDSKVRVASLFANGKLADWWTAHVTAGLGDDRAIVRTNGVYNSRFDTDNRQLTWQNDFRLAAGQTLQAGYERLEQSLQSDAFAAPDRQVNSVFAGYAARFGAHQIQANVRRDQYSDVGGANTYYLGYGFDFAEHWKATASYSSAFRAPSFDDLYYPGSGNASIRPERSHSVEAALQYASGTLGVLRLTAFQTRYADLINYVPTQGGSFYVAENVDRAKVQGLEGSWRGRVGKTDVRAALTVQNPVDEASDTDLARRARRFASLSASRSLGAWRIGGAWIVSGPRDDNGAGLGGFGLVNLSARYAITKAWYVSAHIDNLFDKDYELAYPYNTPRRSAFITIGWQEL